MSNTIHLPIKRKWFDMILSGEKKEEYREVKPYWWKRLLTVPSATSIAHHLWPDYELSDLEGCGVAPKYGNATTLTLTAGYGKDKPRIIIDLKWIDIKKTNPAWCPPKTKGLWFSLRLGEILETHNLPVLAD